MVSKLDKQAIVGEFDSHWVPHTSDLVPQLNEALVNNYLEVVLRRLRSGEGES